MELNKQEITSINDSDVYVERTLRKINIVELIKNLKATSFWEKEGLTALIKLIIKLREKIGEYETIISDDASGRLIALTLQKIANKIREANNKDRIRVLFVAGGAGINNRIIAINELIENNKDKLGKTLLVTDSIQSGESIERLSEILNKNNINFDIAAVSIERNPKLGYNKHLNNLFERLYYGESGSAGLSFYGRSSYAGVYKNINTKEAFPESDNDQLDDMKNVREDINLMVDKIFKVIS